MDIGLFSAMNIDLSPLGFILNGAAERYYCTPENADILATAGVDGIHFCTIPQYGEIIFAVSPMNFGDCVHPIARNFEDLLRLLLHCADVAALEQCYAWDEEQYKAFLIDCPATAEQKAVLDEIKSRCNLEPVSDSFAYVKKLQSECDMSLIVYPEDYYDPEMNAAAPEKSAEWAVYYDCGFWNKNAKGKPGEEIAVNKSFAWGGEVWHIPAVYSCAEGLVIDFCVEIEPEKEKAFIDKWHPVLAEDENISNELQEQIENENPMDINFRVHLQIDGEPVTEEHGTSINRIPACCLPDGAESERESGEIIRHYGLDDTRAWVFHRWAFPWTTEKKPELRSLKLKLERDPVAVQGIHFRNPSVGDVFSFVHPIHKTEYKLTVLGYEKQELSVGRFQQEEYEFPSLHTVMTYKLEPEPAKRNFRVRDCLDNEQPRRRAENQPEAYTDNEAQAIAIIGGADGPTAIFASAVSDSQLHTALSALRFEHADDIEWKMVFSEKLTEDFETDLLC